MLQPRQPPALRSPPAGQHWAGLTEPSPPPTIPIPNPITNAATGTTSGPLEGGQQGLPSPHSAHQGIAMAAAPSATPKAACSPPAGQHRAGLTEPPAVEHRQPQRLIPGVKMWRQAATTAHDGLAHAQRGTDLRGARQQQFASAGAIALVSAHPARHAPARGTPAVAAERL